MADMLGTGLSGLRAMQRALDTTAHNIANVSTEGYTRQRVDFATRRPQILGRQLDRHRRRRRRRAPRLRPVRRRSRRAPAAPTSRASRPSPRRPSASTTCSAIRPTAYRASLQNFTDAHQRSVAARRPRSRRARCCSPRAQALAERLKTYDSAPARHDRPRSTRASRGEAREITHARAGHRRAQRRHLGRHAGTPASRRTTCSTSATSLIDQLSGKVGVTVVAEGDSTLNVFVGNGQPLVLGNTASQITTAPDPLDPERTAARAAARRRGTVDISRSVSGGTLGGLLDWRSEMLDPARNELGRISVAVADQVNAQHREGMDLTGALGGNFFNVGGVGVTARHGEHRHRRGRRHAHQRRRAHGERLRAAQHRHGLHAAPPGHGRGRRASPAPARWRDPILADGLSIVVGAGIRDRRPVHRFVPTRDAIAGMTRGDHRSVARRRGGADPRRRGHHQHRHRHAHAGRSARPDERGLLTTVNIEFTSATTYSVNGAGSFTYTAGLEHRRQRLARAGQRRARRRATASPCATTPAPPATTAMPSRWPTRCKAGVLDGGTTSVDRRRRAPDGRHRPRRRAPRRSAATRQQVVNDSDIAARDAMSGVNLDEEAANMLRYQQAYQAAAQIIAVAEQMFDTLLNAVRR